MYVCLCHGFTDRDLRGSAAACDGTVSDLYRVLGVRPTCGKCVPMVREAVRPTTPFPALTHPAATA
jgi:bacterioferritin-associated ferredoxin